IAIHWPRKDKLGLLPAAKPFLQLRCPTFWLLLAPKVTPAQRQILYKHIKVIVVYIIIIKNKLIAVYNCKDSYPKGHASQAKPVQNDRVIASGNATGGDGISPAYDKKKKGDCPATAPFLYGVNNMI
ncbi:MAG: hypothetical protein IJ362_07820, partial [Oscillospiraceae bacterium]|nr:hypothetical protein [Oscillospiraceae bacterium]